MKIRCFWNEDHKAFFVGKSDLERVKGKFEHRVQYMGEIQSMRSWEQLKFYHSGIKEAHDNWPESHEMQFDDVGDFRRWVQMYSGAPKFPYRHHISCHQEGVAAPETLAAAIHGSLLAAGVNPIVVTKGEQAWVIWSKSIAVDKMNHNEFNALCNDVFDFIEEQSGIRIQVRKELEHGT